MLRFNSQSAQQLPDPRSEEFIERLSAALRDQNLLDDLAARRARRAQSQANERFDIVLTRLGLVTDVALAGVLSQLLDIPLAQARDYPDVALFSKELQPAFLKANRLLPLSDGVDGVVFATADPFNAEALTALSYLLERPIALRMAPAGELDRRIERLYGPKIGRASCRERVLVQV